MVIYSKSNQGSIQAVPLVFVRQFFDEIHSSSLPSHFDWLKIQKINLIPNGLRVKLNKQNKKYSRTKLPNEKTAKIYVVLFLYSFACSNLHNLLLTQALISHISFEIKGWYVSLSSHQ